MFPVASSLATLLLASVAAAVPAGTSSSGVPLPFTKHVTTSGGAVNIVEQNQARIAALKGRVNAIQSNHLEHRDSENVGITPYNPTTAYIASVKVGSPPTSYNLLVEFSGANTWVGADKPYKPTSTSKDTGEPVGIIYLSNTYWNGEEWLDTVDLGNGLVITNQSIGVADSSYGYPPGVDGMLGIGPTYLTVATLWNQLGSVFPTVTDNLYYQGTIPEDSFSFYLAPSVGGNHAKGEITFGGTDSTKYIGQINYVPTTTVKPSSNFWGLDISITYGEKTILKQTAGIIDAALTTIGIASDAYSAYKNATGAAEDATTRMLKLTTLQYQNLQTLTFHIGSTTFTLTPNAQIWPRALNSYIGGTHDAIYSIVSDLGTPSGLGLDFVLGQPFLERFYSVYDTTHARIGFATTDYTDAAIN